MKSHVKNISLSADETVIARARQVARARRTTLNTAFREWLSEFASPQANIREFDMLMDRLSYVKVDKAFTPERNE